MGLILTTYLNSEGALLLADMANNYLRRITPITDTTAPPDDPGTSPVIGDMVAVAVFDGGSMLVLGTVGEFLPTNLARNAKVWVTGDGVAAATFYADTGEGFEAFPEGFGGPFSATDLVCHTIKEWHFQFFNPQPSPMKVLVIAKASLNITRPGGVDATAGLLASFTAPADFDTTGITPGGTIPGGLTAGGIDKTMSAADLTVTRMFEDIPTLVIAPGATVDYYIELFFGASDYHGSSDPIESDFWQFQLTAFGVEDVG